MHVPVGMLMAMEGMAMLFGTALNTCESVADNVATCCVAGVVGSTLSWVVVVGVVGVAVVCR